MMTTISTIERFKISCSDTELSVLCEETAKKILDQKHWGTPEETGFYLLSPDAGAAAAVSFWQSALEVGPGLVSPGNFPWTLANGPASYLARLLTIKGPNHTLVGNDAEWPALEQIAESDLRAGRIQNAVLLYLEVDEKQGFWQRR